MWFKNLVAYRLPADWSLSPIDLEERLARRPLRPCGPLEMTSRGWVAPAASGRFLHTVGRHHLLALGVEQRLLPASVIRQVADERAAALAEEQGFPVGRRQLRELRHRVADELRPRAFTRRRTTRAWLDAENGWFVVDAAGAPRAEELVEFLRETLGTFAVVLPDTERSPAFAMAAWLRQGEAPLRFAIDQDLELRALDKSKATVRYARHPLDGRQVQAHLAGGMGVVRLGLTWNDRIAFVLTEQLQLKRVQFLELDRETSAATGELDVEQQFDAEFLVMTGELSALLGELAQALGTGGARQQAA